MQRLDCRASTSEQLEQFICEEAKRIYALINYTAYLTACEAVTPGHCGCVGAARTQADALVRCKLLHDVTCACLD